MNDEKLKLISMDTVAAKEVNWLWYPYVPPGKITVLQGDPGEGKTMLALSLAAMLTKGLPLPEQTEGSLPVTVIYQTGEDGLVLTLTPTSSRMNSARRLYRRQSGTSGAATRVWTAPALPVPRTEIAASLYERLKLRRYGEEVPRDGRTVHRPLAVTGGRPHLLCKLRPKPRRADYCRDRRRRGDGKCRRFMHIHHVAIYINDEFLIDSTGGDNSVQMRKHWGENSSTVKWVCFGRPTN